MTSIKSIPTPRSETKLTLASPVRLLGLSLAAAVTLLVSSVHAEESAAPPGLGGDSANRTYDSKFSSEIIEITMAPGEQLEYVLDVRQGDSLLYSWQVDKGNLYSDFHGSPDDKEKYPENYWIRYEESEDAGAHGAVVAPFTGHTAWYWVNKNDHPVKIELELVGYFSGNKVAFRELPE